MESIPDNATRIKRFRELKATLRTAHDRLLVGIDVAKAQHVAQVRVAHTRIVDATLSVPNTQAGFDALWARLEARQVEARVREVVCALEPTGTYHQALATFLERQGATVVFVNNHVAELNRRTLDGTWGKSDPKDAHNLCDLLEQAKVLFDSRPDEPVAALRRLVRLLRQARGDLGACKARLRNTLLPQLGPAGEALPPALVAARPGPVQALLPRAERRRAAAARPAAALPPGLAVELADLAARVTATQARCAQLEAELVRLAAPLPAYGLLRTIPGIGPTVAAILLAEIGDIAWYSRFSQLRKLAGLDIVPWQTGQRKPLTRISKAGRALLRWALVPGGDRRGAESGLARPARGAHRQAPGRSVRLLQGDRGARRETPPARVGRLAQRAALRPGARGDTAAEAGPRSSILGPPGRSPLRAVARGARAGAPAARGRGSAMTPWRRLRATAAGTEARLSRFFQPGHGRLGTSGSDDAA